VRGSLLAGEQGHESGPDKFLVVDHDHADVGHTVTAPSATTSSGIEVVACPRPGEALICK
jgi:hypothetical protein